MTSARAATVCVEPGCPRAATRRGRCVAHQLPRIEGRPWRRLVAEVVRRDGGRCWICRQPGATSADHLIPVAAGGSDDLINLAACHLACNMRRGTSGMWVPGG